MTKISASDLVSGIDRESERQIVSRIAVASTISGELRGAGNMLHTRAAVAVGVILALALLLRVVNLDADPSALIGRDFITDEGWWAHNARNALLFGQWRTDDYNLGLYSASLYNIVIYVVFRLLGVSFTTLRLVPALAGWLTVVLLFLLVRRELSTRAAVFATVLLGFSNLHVMYSRTGFPESTTVFFLALTLWFWSLRRTHAAFALASGAAFSLVFLSKVTAIYLIPGFVLVIAVETVRRTVSRRQVVLFLLGAAAVGVAYTSIFIVPDLGSWVRFNISNGSGSEWSTGVSPVIGSILKLLGSSFYAQAPLITALSLLAVCLLLVNIASGGLRKTIRDAADLEITCACLLIGYLLSLSLTLYQPERRFLPALFLMVILSAGVLARGWTGFREVVGNNQMGAVGWFAVLFPLLGLGIVEAKLGGHLSLFGSIAVWLAKLVLIAGLFVTAVAMSRGRWPYRFRNRLRLASGSLFVLLFCFLSLALIYKALMLWGLDVGAWKLAVTGKRPALVIGWTIAVMCGGFALAAVGLTVRRIPGWGAAGWVMAAFVVVEGLQLSTWALQPTYTLKGASTYLAGTLTHDVTAVTYYETVMLSSDARAVCRSVRRGFNVDAFEKYNPQYILVLRRDNWKDYAQETMPVEEWPPPAGHFPTKAATFDLCPTRLRGPRFILELYRLSPR